MVGTRIVLLNRTLSPRSSRNVSIGLFALAALPVVVGMARALTGDWVPIGDRALIELRVGDVGGGETPLVGPYSRYGWNHPGPLLFWVLAGPYRLLGGSSGGILVGAGLVTLAAVAAIATVAHRRGGPALVALAMLGVVLLMAAGGSDTPTDAWNPYVTVMPFAALLWLAWDVAEGGRWAVPGAALAATFVVQTHLGYAMPAAAAVVWAVAVAAIRRWRWRRRPASTLGGSSVAHEGVVDEAPGGDGGVSAGGTGQPGWRWPLVATAAVLLVAWAPVAVDQLTGSPGNALKVAEWFARSELPTAGLGSAAGLVWRHLTVEAPWVRGPEPSDWITADAVPASYSTPPVALLVSVVGAGLVIWRRRRPSSRVAPDASSLRLQSLAWLEVVVAVVAVSRVTDAVHPYIIRWVWPIGMLVAVSGVWAVLQGGWPDGRGATRARWIIGGLGVVATVGVLVGALDEVWSSPHDDDQWVPMVEQLRDPLRSALEERGEGPVYLQARGSVFGEMYLATALDLEKGGIEVRVPLVDDIRLGDRRADGGVSATGTVVVATGASVADMLADPAAEPLVMVDPLTPAERAEERELTAALKQQMRDAGRDPLVNTVEGDELSLLPWLSDGAADQEVVDRLIELRGRGMWGGAFLTPLPSPPP